jgi:steroid 5-alpha reductase family enzyme
MSMITIALVGWAVAAVVFAVLWLDEWRRNDASAVDVGWSFTIGVLAIVFAVLGPGDVERRALVGTLAALWAFRLAGFLFVNRVWGRPEDGRYQRMRAWLGPRAHLGFFVFYQMQAFWTVLFAIPFLVVVSIERGGLVWLDYAGAAVWLVAVVGEAISDAQLARFRANPANRGRTCREGLWRYSRHPNYFFEWVHWFAYVVMAIGAPWGWVAWSGPALMLLFLFKVTGIPHTERQALASRGEDYRRYQQETSIFIPWFPRKAGNSS